MTLCCKFTSCHVNESNVWGFMEKIEAKKKSGMPTVHEVSLVSSLVESA